MSDAARAVMVERTDPTVVVAEERAHVTKEIVEVGRVVVTKHVHEHTTPLDAVLAHEDLEVERVPLDIYVEQAPAVRVEGETTIIPVLKEVAVVVKRLVLVEEVRVRKRRTQHLDRHSVTLRTETVDIEPVDASDPTSVTRR